MASWKFVTLDSLVKSSVTIFQSMWAQDGTEPLNFSFTTTTVNKLTYGPSAASLSSWWLAIHCFLAKMTWTWCALFYKCSMGAKNCQVHSSRHSSRTTCSQVRDYHNQRSPSMTLTYLLSQGWSMQIIQLYLLRVSVSDLTRLKDLPRKSCSAMISLMIFLNGLMMRYKPYLNTTNRREMSNRAELRLN